MTLKMKTSLITMKKITVTKNPNADEEETKDYSSRLHSSNSKICSSSSMISLQLTRKTNASKS